MMASKYPDMDTVDVEIERLQRSVESINHELTEDRKHRGLSRSLDTKPPRLALLNEQSATSEEKQSLAVKSHDEKKSRPDVLAGRNPSTSTSYNLS